MTNTGRRAGIAVPQLYLGLPGARGPCQPPRQLKGFEAARPPRAPATRSFRLDTRAFSYWSSRRIAGGSPPAATGVVGRSSRKLVLRATDRRARRALRTPGGGVATPQPVRGERRAMSEPATPKSRTRKVSWQLPRPPHSRCWSSRRAHRPASPIERQRPRRPRRKRGARGWSTAAPSPAGAAASPHPQGRELRPAEHREHGAPADDRPDRRADAPYSRCADPVGRVWPPPLAAADARPPRARARSGPGRPAPASAAEAQRKLDSDPRARSPTRGPRGVAAGEAAHLHPSDQEIQAANARRSRSWYRTSQRARCRTPSSASSPGTAHPISRARGTTSGRTSRRTVRSPRRSRRPGRPEPPGSSPSSTSPARQIRGYFDPRGTHFRVQGVFVGGAEGDRLKRLAAQGRSVRVVVRARADRARTRNLIATLPGRSRQRIVLSTEHGRQHLRPGERECGPDRAARATWRGCLGGAGNGPSSSRSAARICTSRGRAPIATPRDSIPPTTGARSRSCSRSSTSARGRSSRAVRAAG